MDANVLISAISLQSPRIGPIIEYLFGAHEFCITPHVASELTRNTLRLKPQMSASIQEFLNRDELLWIEEFEGSRNIVHRDSSDQPILNAAIDNDVEIIISGDKGFHALDISHPRVMYPADFIAEFIPGTD